VTLAPLGLSLSCAFYGGSEAMQAQNLDVALQTFESRSDVARTFVFKVDDYAGWGLFRSDWTAKPSVATYQAHDQGCTTAPPPSDAGADAATTPDASPGLDAALDAPGDAEPAAPPPPSGCSCDVPATGGGSAGAWWAVALSCLLAMRRRRV
jgi:MYXO-CTERM domain-containing protein